MFKFISPEMILPIGVETNSREEKGGQGEKCGEQRRAKARRGAEESEKKSSEMERSIGSDWSREISTESTYMKLRWKEEEEEGSQERNGTTNFKQ